MDLYQQLKTRANSETLGLAPFDWGSALGLGTALALAAIGQAMLLDDSVGLGLAVYAIATVIFVPIVARVDPPAPWPPAVPEPLAQRAPVFVLWVTTSVSAAITIQGVSHPDGSTAQGYFLALTWLLSIGLFSVSVLRAAGWHWPGRAEWVEGWRAHRREGLAVASIGLLALTLRTLDIEHPYAFVNDEGAVGREGLRILRGEWGNLFAVGWASQPRWSFVPAAASVALFGNTVFAVRLVSAIGGALAVVFVYLLAREMFGRRVGFLAAAFLLALPVHIHFSRLGVNNANDAMLSALVLWLVWRAVRRGRISGYLWAGLAAGFTVYSYVGSRLVPALAVGTLGYVALRQRDYLRGHVLHLLIFTAGALLVAGPMLVFFVQHPNDFWSRIRAEGILQNGWLINEAVLTGRSIVAILLEQLSKSTLVYVAQAAPLGFFHSPKPYLTGVAAVFFVLGMGYSAWRLKEPRHMTVLTWFWAVVILGGVLTVGAPASQRLLMSTPALALFAAIGLHQTALTGQRMGWLPARWGPVACALVVGFVGLQGVKFYFDDYREGHYFEDASNELALVSSRYAEKLGPDYHFYLIGEPRVYVDFPNFHFLAPDLAKEDFNSVTNEALAAIPPDQKAFFVAAPERRADLERVAQRLPGGQWLKVSRRNFPEPLYYSYLISPP